MEQNQSVINREALKPFRNAISRYVRSVMQLNNIKYRELVARLEAKGLVITESNLRSKLGRGALSADLFVLIFACIEAEEQSMQKMVSLAQNND